MPTYQERNGRTRAIVRRKGQPSISKTFGRKSDAVKWARKTEAELDAGGAADAKESLFALMTRYRNEVSVHKKGWKWEQTRIDAFLRLPWVQLRASECGDDINEWAQRRRKEVSDATVNRELNVISHVFTYAMKHWRLRLGRNPISLVVRPPGTKHRTRRVPQHIVDKIWSIDRSPQYSISWYLPIMFEFAVETGMRLGELCKLQWEDVYESQSWVHVIESKNGDDRKVPLSARAVELLGMVPKSRGGVFPPNAGSVGTLFRRQCKTLKIVNLHFHDTRHEAISRLAKVYPVLQLSAISGHRDLKFLQVYYNPTIEELVQHMRGATQPTPPHP
jgi:integrase